MPFRDDDFSVRSESAKDSASPTPKKLDVDRDIDPGREV